MLTFLALQVSLAHFCENDGPTSILCTQVLPVSCHACYPLASVSSSIGDLGAPAIHTQSKRSSIAGLDTSDLDEALAEHAHAALDLQSPTTSKADRPESLPSSIDPDYRKGNAYRVLGDDGGCVSCKISVPETICSQLPAGAPGSPKPNGRGRNGSPVLRSREAVHACGSQHSDSATDNDLSPEQSSPESFASDTSTSSCHTHTLEFVTTSKPMKSNTYALLRRACIRTLSCEQLPRGLAAGKLFFGDPVAGYVVAYKFRLTDPFARGRQRHYALLALAGHDPGRAFKATPIIWRAFEQMVTKISSSTEKAMQNGNLPAAEPGEKQKPAAISSFLTQRTVDPDGFPRRGGTATRPRGLAEMVNNELFFPELHRNFVALLQNLGRQFGGVTIEPSLADSQEAKEHGDENVEADERPHNGREQWERESVTATPIAA